MPPDEPRQPAKPKPDDSGPVEVREPDNTRPPHEPTPRHPEKPQSLYVEADEEDKGE